MSASVRTSPDAGAASLHDEPPLETRISLRSTYVEERWYLDILQVHLRDGMTVVRFDKMSPKGSCLTHARFSSLLASIKHVLWLRRFRPMTGDRLLGDTGLISLGNSLVIFGLFLADRGVTSFSTVTGRDLSHYDKHLLSGRNLRQDGRGLANLRFGVMHMWTYRHRIRDGLSFRPWKGSVWASVAATKEGKTPAIPPEVFLPLMAKAMEILDASGSVPCMKLRKRPTSEQRLLMVSCYVIIAFLSGARISEIATFDAGRIEARVAPGRATTRYRLHGTCWKNSPDGQGVPAWWGVAELGGKAAKRMAELTFEFRKQSSLKSLFLMMGNNGRPRPIECRTLMRPLRELAEAANVPEDVPLRITNHMFRTTLAQWIARQPNGIIHGAIHMRQLSTAVFQGYLRQDQEFQKLCDLEVLKWQSDVYEEIVSAGSLGGRAGMAIMRKKGKACEPAPPMLTRLADDVQPDEIERSVKRGKLVVFQTLYGHCLFDRQSARCLASAPETVTRPRTHACMARDCANMCVLPRDVPAWMEDIEEYETIKAMPGASQGQIETCNREIASLKQGLGPLIDG